MNNSTKIIHRLPYIVKLYQIRQLRQTCFPVHSPSQKNKHKRISLNAPALIVKVFAVLRHAVANTTTFIRTTDFAYSKTPPPPPTTPNISSRTSARYMKKVTQHSHTTPHSPPSITKLLRQQCQDFFVNAETFTNLSTFMTHPHPHPHPHTHPSVRPSSSTTNAHNICSPKWNSLSHRITQNEQSSSAELASAS